MTAAPAARTAATLAPLVASLRAGSPVARPPSGCCAFCGGPIGLHADTDAASCAACTLVRHLDRPRIDEEARVAWLPEMSQAALICLIRVAHAELWAVGSSFDGEGFLNTPRQAGLRHVCSLLTDRCQRAAEILGSARPSDLARVLRRLAPQNYARRHKLLGGLRVLPAGRFFAGDDDVYPCIVASWHGDLA